MVWKDNFIVEEKPMTLEGFLDRFFGLSLNFSTFNVFDFRLCYFKKPKDIFDLGSHLDEKHFPKHYLFANFQCLRCGLCCKNYECVSVEREQIEDWRKGGRTEILRYVFGGGFALPEIYPRGMTGCPLCRKVRGKPYYGCKIHSVKDCLPVCKVYLCSKSLPLAHFNYKDVDGLIRMIGLKEYYSLIERDWGEEFDYSTCTVKTHWRSCSLAPS